MANEFELEPKEMHVPTETYEVSRRAQQRLLRREHVLRLIEKLSTLSGQADWDQEWFQQAWQTATSLNSYLTASASAIGECRRATPYAPLRPVIDARGHFKWCCEHNPEHCAG